MTNEELMQMMTSMDLHEGGMENWLLDNAWLRVANAVEAKEREACAKVCDVLSVHPEYASEVTKLAAMAIRARGQE